MRIKTIFSFLPRGGISPTIRTALDRQLLAERSARSNSRSKTWILRTATLKRPYGLLSEREMKRGRSARRLSGHSTQRIVILNFGSRYLKGKASRFCKTTTSALRYFPVKLTKKVFQSTFSPNAPIKRAVCGRANENLPRLRHLHRAERSGTIRNR